MVQLRGLTVIRCSVSLPESVHFTQSGFSVQYMHYDTYVIRYCNSRKTRFMTGGRVNLKACPGFTQWLTKVGVEHCDVTPINIGTECIRLFEIQINQTSSALN